jgi:hypothetical protein
MPIIPSYSGGSGKRNVANVQPGQKPVILSEKQTKEKELGRGSSGRGLAKSNSVKTVDAVTNKHRKHTCSCIPQEETAGTKCKQDPCGYCRRSFKVDGHVPRLC